MDSLDLIIEKYTKHMSPVVLNFHETFPNAQSISNECTEVHVLEIIKRITVLSTHRDDIENQEDIDFDHLDDLWRATVRYSNLLTCLSKKYQNEILIGLKSQDQRTRFYIASVIYEAPFGEAIPHLKAAIETEMNESNKSIFEKALAASESIQKGEVTWGKLFSKIGKLLGLTHHSSGTR